jgi:type I restriction-modification system DNA methylase subunit
LSTEDENLIIDTFNNNVSLERFSEVVDSSEIEKNNYSINPGQYFNVSKTIHNITQQEFDKIQKSSLIKIEHLFDENLSNGKQIVQILKKATLNDQK